METAADVGSEAPALKDGATQHHQHRSSVICVDIEGGEQLFVTACIPTADPNGVCRSSDAELGPTPGTVYARPPKTVLSNSSSDEKAEVTLVINLSPFTTAATIPVNIGFVNEDFLRHTMSIRKLPLADNDSGEDEDILQGEDTKEVIFRVKVESTQLCPCTCGKPRKKIFFRDRDARQ